MPGTLGSVFFFKSFLRGNVVCISEMSQLILREVNHLISMSHSVVAEEDEKLGPLILTSLQILVLSSS